MQLILLLNKILVLYIAISSIFPTIRAIVRNNAIIVVFFMLFWSINSFFISPKFFYRPTKQRGATFIVIIYTAIVPYLFNNSIIAHRYMNFSSIFFFYIVYEFNNYVGREKDTKRIVKLSVPFFIVTLFKTAKALIVNPSISRSIKSSDEYTMDILFQGIGGYEFIYFLVFLIIITIYLIISQMNYMRRSTNIFLILLTVISVFVVILSNYFTALLLIIVIPIMMLLMNFITRRKYIQLFIVLLITIFLFLYIDKIAIFILELAINIIDKGYNHIRLIIIKENLLYGSSVDISNNRFGIFMTSVNSFLENPYFGIIKTPLKTSGGYLQGFGQHSFIMDTFALFGFGLGLIQVYMICQPFLRRIRKNKKFRDFLVPLFFAMLIIFNFNTVTPSFGFVLFMILPMIYDYLISIES